MDFDTMDFETAIKTIMATRRGDTAAPSPDELMSFRAGLPEDTEKLLEQAAVCPETAYALLDAARFPDVAPTDRRQRVTEENLTANWLRFQQRSRREAGPEVSEAPLVRPARRRLGRILDGGRRLWSLTGSLGFAQAAAALLLVSLGLSWLIVPRGPGQATAGPRLNLPIVELTPEAESGERTAAEPVRPSRAADGILLVLTLRDRRSYPVYEVEIYDSAGTPGGTLVWSSTALERAAEGFFTLELPRGFLPAGRYRVALHGIGGDRRDRLAVYHLSLEQ